MTGQAARVLLVDDEDNVRLTLGAVLAHHGYTVATAASADEALALIGAEPFDVLVADLQLGDGRSGVELVKAVLERDLDVVTIILTAYVSTQAAVDALRGGATNFLAKPCNIQELSDAIARGLERRELLQQLRLAQRDAAGRAEAERLRNEAEQARERAERDAARVAFLASAGEQLVASLDYRDILEKLARLAVAGLADWCVVDVVERDMLEHVAVAHVDPAKEELAREVQRQARHAEARSGLIDRVLETGEPAFVADIPPSDVEDGQYDAETTRLLAELAPRSMICVPLIAGGRPLGVISLLMSDSGRRFQQEDVDVALDLGRRAGLAIEHARLYNARRLEIDRLRQIIDQLPEAILVVDRDGLLVASNGVAQELVGPLQPGQVPNDGGRRYWLSDMEGERLSHGTAPISRARLLGEVVQGCQVLMHRTGAEPLPILVNATPLRDETNQVVGAVGVFQDISGISRARLIPQPIPS